MPHKYLNVATALGVPFTHTRSGEIRLDWTKIAFPAIVAFLVGTVAYAINDSQRQGATDTALLAVTTALRDNSSTLQSMQQVLTRLDATLKVLEPLPDRVNELSTHIAVIEATESKRHGR